MGVEFFSSDNIDFRENERKQYERLKEKLIVALSGSEQRYCFVVDYIIGSKQYDIILIKRNSIISIELKSFRGKVIGSENGPWSVAKDDGELVAIDRDKNPFLQARDQRYALLDWFNERLGSISARFSDEIHNITSIVCFEKGSTYDFEQIEYRKLPWFVVTNEDELIDVIKRTDSREYSFKDCEIDAIIKEMNLQKLDAGPGKEIKDYSPRAVLDESDIGSITDLVLSKFGAGKFDLEDLTHYLRPEIVMRYLENASSRGIVKKMDGGQFSLADGWSDMLPTTYAEGESSAETINVLSKAPFWLRPNKPRELEEYEGIYRGTEYHINFNRKVWWQQSGCYPRIAVKIEDEAILDAILALKPQGGSFRITECGEVLTKTFDEGRGYVPKYVGKFKGEIVCEDLEWKPKGLKPGHLWPGLYDGTKFSVNTSKQLLIHIGTNKVYAKTGHESLVQMVLQYNGRYGGGSFKITESGSVLVLLYKAPYPERIKDQLAGLNDAQKNMIDIRKALEKDERVPIYIGNFNGNIQFQPIFDIKTPWTENENEEFLKRLGG